MMLATSKTTTTWVFSMLADTSMASGYVAAVFASFCKTGRHFLHNRQHVHPHMPNAIHPRRHPVSPRRTQRRDTVRTDTPTGEKNRPTHLDRRRYPLVTLGVVHKWLSQHWELQANRSKQSEPLAL
jgi:hypothetical protein